METQQPSLYVALAITLAAATTTLVLRFVARRMTQVSLGFDDYFCIAAYLFAIVWAVLAVLWAKFGGLGLHLENIDLTTEGALYVSKLYLYFIELTYATSLAFSKCAILAFYWRMFKSSKIRLPIIVLFVCAVLWWVLRTFIAIFHCIPVNAFWDPNIPGAYCMVDDSKFFFGSVLAHFVIDVLILALPVVEIGRLQLRRDQKIGVISMFLFGTLVCVASVVVLVDSLQFDTTSPEMPWNIAQIIIWATVEVNLAVLSACLPLLRPIFKMVLRTLRIGSSNASAGDRYHPSKPKSFVKLQTLNKDSTVKEDSDSWEHPHTPDRGPSREEDSAPIIDGVRGFQTIISAGSSDPSDMERGRSGKRIPGAILVKNETSVRISDYR